MRLSEFDSEDAGLVSEAELGSDGTSVIRVESVVDVVSGTITVPSTAYLRDYDDPIQPGDIAIISGNAAAGTYTVDTVPTLSTFTVVEAIVDAGAGSVEFRHPAASSRVGVDPTPLSFTSATNLQQVLVDLLPFLLPAATMVGDHLVSKDGSTFEVAQPIVGADDGWLSNADAELLIEGLDP